MMNPAIESPESEGAAERLAQKELTERVGVSLVRRGKSKNLKWSTWKERFAMRAEEGK